MGGKRRKNAKFWVGPPTLRGTPFMKSIGQNWSNQDGLKRDWPKSVSSGGCGEGRAGEEGGGWGGSGRRRGPSGKCKSQTRFVCCVVVCCMVCVVWCGDEVCCFCVGGADSLLPNSSNWTAQNFAFFCLRPKQVSLFLLPLEGLFVEFGGIFNAGALLCARKKIVAGELPTLRGPSTLRGPAPLFGPCPIPFPRPRTLWPNAVLPNSVEKIGQIRSIRCHMRPHKDGQIRFGQMRSRPRSKPSLANPTSAIFI